MSGLLALMLLTNARRAARTGADGALVSLAEQDRGRWDQRGDRRGHRAGQRRADPRASVGPYQLQAAIAAVHAEAPAADATDWPQVLALYTLLERVAPGPMVTLNRAVAAGMARGPRAGLEVVDALDRSGALEGHHRLDAVRAHLLELDGQADAARAAYERAAQRTTSRPEQRYLRERLQAAVRARRRRSAAAGDRLGQRLRRRSRKREHDGGAPAGRLLDAHAAVVALHDALDDGQAHAGALVGAQAVQAVEHLEDPLALVGRDADPVVGDDQRPVAALGARGDLDRRRHARAGELQRVGQQVLQRLVELVGIAAHGRQLADDDRRARLGDARAERVDGPARDLLEVHARQAAGAARPTRE